MSAAAREQAGSAPALLRALAPAKINIGLFVGGVREDGRHELASVMQAISLADEVAMEPAPAGAGGDQLECPGVDGPTELNLAMRALTEFRSATGWNAPPQRLAVLKRVPVAAGLGGGSGDAAAVLRLAAVASGLTDEPLLRRIAGRLGADVPAQVKPGRWLATGAGESLQELVAPAQPFGVLVLPSEDELSTAAVYAELDRRGSLRTAEEVEDCAQRLAAALGSGAALPPADLVANDLQPPALALRPEIAGALDEARHSGADLALLSGSGPTVLGLFAGADGPARARRAAARLAGRVPAAIAAVPVGDDAGRPMRHNGARMAS